MVNFPSADLVNYLSRGVKGTLKNLKLEFKLHNAHRKEQEKKLKKGLLTTKLKNFKSETTLVNMCVCV